MSIHRAGTFRAHQSPHRSKILLRIEMLEDRAVPAVVSVSDVAVTEGDSGSANAGFRVTLSEPVSNKVRVRYTTFEGTAKAGSDFQPKTGALLFQPGQTSKSIIIPILGDTLAEPAESFNVVLTRVGGAALGDSVAVGTIVDDDSPPASAEFDFEVESDWGSGFSALIRITNTGSVPINGWQLDFDFPYQLTSIWDGEITSQNGNHYSVVNVGWNEMIPVGGTVSFGFTGTPGNVTTEPTNYVLSGGSGGNNQDPTAVNDNGYAYVGDTSKIAVLANDNDPDSDTLQVVAAAQGLHGITTVNGDGTVSYTPHAGFTGSDAFTYTVSDGHGGLAAATVSVTVVDPSVIAWPAHWFAPYVDMALYPMYDLVGVAQSQGVKFFTLAFVVAGPGNIPAWGGFAEYSINGSAFDVAMQGQIAGVRSVDGDVIVSFGGANGQELAQVITDVNVLKAKYQIVVDTYRLTRLDFDIEGGAVADRVSVDRRSQALAALQQDAAEQGKNLEIWLTLPVLPTGLTPDGLYVVQSAKNFGVRLAGVNIMAMDYGDEAAPDPDGKMGDYAIQAATSLFVQLKGVYGGSKTDPQLWKMVGVTPMIGLNDVITEVFDQQEANELIAFAKQQGVGRLSFWSLNRDKQNPAGEIGYVEPTSSSILQEPFEFSQIFGNFVH